MVGITTRVPWWGASIQQVKTARKTAWGIAAKLLVQPTPDKNPPRKKRF
jgi:hypothetical protein